MKAMKAMKAMKSMKVMRKKTQPQVFKFWVDNKAKWHQFANQKSLEYGDKFNLRGVPCVLAPGLGNYRCSHDGVLIWRFTYFGSVVEFSYPKLDTFSCLLAMMQ